MVVVIIKDEEFEKIKKEMTFLSRGKGSEGRVYRYNDLAVKILKNPTYPHIEDGYNFLQRLNAERFTLIKDKIYENNRMIGFTMDFVDDKYEPLDYVPMSKFISDFKMINTDLSMFNKNKVYLVDVHKQNVLFNGSTYVIDTNSYMPVDVYRELREESQTEDEVVKKVAKNNLTHINVGLISFLGYRLSSKFSEEEKARFGRGLIADMGGISNNLIYIGDYLQSDVSSFDTLESYAKRRLEK